jgi:hypothetical protein
LGCGTSTSLTFPEEPTPRFDGGSVDSAKSSADDAEAGPTLDASCPGLLPEPIVPDAQANTCAISPEDLSCDTATDCKALHTYNCSCADPVYGVNQKSTAVCGPPPCPPPLPGTDPCADAAGNGFVTQDCRIVPSLAQVGLACVNHQCVTVAAP